MKRFSRSKVERGRERERERERERKREREREELLKLYNLRARAHFCPLRNITKLLDSQFGGLQAKNTAIS
jgi:hypothetical protein